MKTIKLQRKTAINLLISCCLLGIIAFSFVKPKIRPISQPIKQPDFVFEKVTITQLANGHPIWEIKANTAQIDKVAQLITLQKVTGTFFEKNKTILKMTARLASFNINTTNLLLKNTSANFLLPARSIALQATDLQFFATEQQFVGSGQIELLSPPVRITGSCFLVNIPVKMMLISGQSQAIIDTTPMSRKNKGKT